MDMLGGGRWERARAKAEKAVEDFAATLLRTAAEREAMPGEAFPPDHEWQGKFEAEFVYVPTVDQVRAIAETKADMERTRPMDRLICGDVGYGKTEVAIRAAFKAVMGGKQVVILAPTTVLAQQHARTLGERFADWPIVVDELSRFRTAAEQREVLRGVAEGRIDVVVGTHVTVVLGGPIQAGSGIPKSPKGAVIRAVLGPFEVLNLSTNVESLNDLIAGILPDMTGTTVESDYPVAVYTGTQRTAIRPPESAGFGKFEETCCTDHLEDPVLPMTSLGKTFAIAHSPYRNGAAPKEPDLVRLLGAAATTVVNTNLPSPNDTFTLAPGALREIWSARDFTIVATEPLYVSQLLVSQAICGRTIGDPSLTSAIPNDQYRSDYLFLMPPSWSENYVVLTVPAGTEAAIRVDGAALPATCTSATVGTIGTTSYLAFRCPFNEGPHKATGSAPFGLMAYGYGNAGSYALAAGANVKAIYSPPPLR